MPNWYFFDSGDVKWVGLGLLYREDSTADKLDKNIFRIAKAYNHPSYRGPQLNHDIALYQLQNPVKFSPYMRPICLHTEPSIPPVEAGEKATTVVGWSVVEAGEYEFTQRGYLCRFL